MRIVRIYAAGTLAGTCKPRPGAGPVRGKYPPAGAEPWSNAQTFPAVVPAHYASWNPYAGRAPGVAMISLEVFHGCQALHGREVQVVVIKPSVLAGVWPCCSRSESSDRGLSTSRDLRENHGCGSHWWEYLGVAVGFRWFSGQCRLQCL